MIRDNILLPEPVWTSPTASGSTGDALHFIAGDLRYPAAGSGALRDFRDGPEAGQVGKGD